MTLAAWPESGQAWRMTTKIEYYVGGQRHKEHDAIRTDPDEEEEDE